MNDELLAARSATLSSKELDTPASELEYILLNVMPSRSGSKVAKSEGNTSNL